MYGQGSKVMITTMGTVDNFVITVKHCFVITVRVFSLVLNLLISSSVQPNIQELKIRHEHKNDAELLEHP